jgi:hypothetical protein
MESRKNARDGPGGEPGAPCEQGGDDMTGSRVGDIYFCWFSVNV